MKSFLELVAGDLRRRFVRSRLVFLARVFACAVRSRRARAGHHRLFNGGIAEKHRLFKRARRLSRVCVPACHGHNVQHCQRHRVRIADARFLRRRRGTGKTNPPVHLDFVRRVPD